MLSKAAESSMIARATMQVWPTLTLHSTINGDQFLKDLGMRNAAALYASWDQLEDTLPALRYEDRQGVIDNRSGHMSRLPLTFTGRQDV